MASKKQAYPATARAERERKKKLARIDRRVDELIRTHNLRSLALMIAEMEEHEGVLD